MGKIKIDWNSIKSQCLRVESTATSLASLLNEFNDVFSPPDGLIRNFKARVLLKDEAVPRFFKARPVPFAVRSKVDLEIDRLVNSGVWSPVDTSEWASPLVIAPRADGRIRITGDFKHTVNSQLHVTQYPLTRTTDLFATLTGGQKFSKLDGPDAFHQVELTDDSKMFMVVNTHRGLFRYNVLPMGISSSPAIFQEFMDGLTKGIPMTGSFLDDVVCSGLDDESHLSNLRKLFERMRDANYRLRKDKSLFMEKSIGFLGYVLTSEGIHTSPSKVESIVSIPKPDNVSKLMSFLGLVNFYRSFVPRFAGICEPLYNLTQKEVEWKWTDACQHAFEEVKRTLSSSEVLVHFNQQLPIGLSCDASPIGLGAVLFHIFPDGSERPIAYASKVLTPAERKYAQPDREALGIVFGVKKFYQYLCGNKFLLVTDQQPLSHVFGPKTQLPSYAATRVHGWCIFLSQFQFEVKYRNTRDHGNADALSRLPVGTEKLPPDIGSHVNLVATSHLESLPVTSAKIRKFSSRDKILSTVFRYARNGWPPTMSKSDPLYPYYLHRDEYNIVQGVILWGVRVLVPLGLQKLLLSELHAGHFGIVRMKSLAREFFWWPNIDSDIKGVALNCRFCMESSHNPPSAPLHPWEFPEKPWQRLHIDLAGPFLNRMWLIVMDAHSKWPEVFCLNNNAATLPIICRLRDCITRFGIPDQIVSDNGSQFTSQEFQEFCKSNGIRHSTSSVYHPRSNGEAERFVQTFKRSMSEAKGQDWELTLQRFLFTYRVTTHATTGSCPSELLQGRKLKCLLDLVRPDPAKNTAESQLRQVKSFDKNTRNRQFVEGQRVWVKTYSKNLPRWSLGKIIKCVGPLTFHVLVDEIVYRRHQDQLLDAGQPLLVEEETGEAEPAPNVPSPAKPKPPQPNPVEFQSDPLVVPVPFEEFSEEEADDYFEALSDDEIPPMPNGRGSTPRASRPQRFRQSPDRFAPSY
jgi:hypothetical protein